MENGSRMVAVARLITLGWIKMQAGGPARASRQEDMMAVDLEHLWGMYFCVKGMKENGY